MFPPTSMNGSSHPDVSRMRAPIGNGQLPSLAELQAKTARMAAFAKLKPTCVILMGIASQPPTNHSRHASLVDTISSTVIGFDNNTLDPAMINYILFPLTTVIRQNNPSILPDNFLESAFRLLAHVVAAWKLRPEGMEVVAWEQLWRFVVAAIGPRMGGSNGREKGKGREIGQEVQLQAVALLTALLEPVSQGPSSALPPRSHPTPEMLEKVATVKSSLLPTLFQTITILLETAAPSPPHLRLQLASLRLLRPLITFYLVGKHNVLAAILPGTISAMSKLVHSEGKAMKGEVAQNAAKVIEVVIVATLDDVDLRDLGVLRPVVDDLTQLGEEWDRTNEFTASDSPPASPASTATPTDPFPPLSHSYLAFTSIQIQAAIPPILSALSTHTSDLARTASASLASALIRQCHESLPLLIPRALSNLLLLNKDAFDPVRSDAQGRLRLLLEKEELMLEPILLDVLSNAINSLPRLVTSQQDIKVEEAARLITAIAETSADMIRATSSSHTRRNAISDLLGPSGAVERWSWRLLDCLEFGRPVGWTAAGNTATRAAEQGWQQGQITTAIPLLLEDGRTTLNGSPERFPPLPLRRVESETTTRALAHMLTALGSAGGDTALYSVEYFVRFAKANRRSQVSKAVSAMWVAEKLLAGIAAGQVEGVDERVGKATRKMAKEVVKLVIAIDEDDDDDYDYDEDGLDYSQDVDSDTLVPIERCKGLNALTTLLDKNPAPASHTAAETKRLHAQAQRALLTALSLETLAVSAHILSSSFRPLLLTSLYILLSHLASPQPIIHEYASLALAQVAYHIGYATPQNMVTDNVDYVINVVSQRLTYQRLSSTAPLVLIAMIRLVGEPIVPLVHDVVDEIFDALDDYHGYEALASSLLAVLVTLIEVMAAEVEAEGLSEIRAKKMEEMNRIDKPPNPSADFGKFFQWWEERDSRNKEQIQEILERAPQHAWGKADISGDQHDKEAGAEGEDEGADAPATDDDAEPPLTRSQQVATRILDKSVYFLTHRSPFLRSKVLSLIANAVPVLARGNRESDLLPLIDKAWGSILNRLDDTEPYVVVEGAEVIASLCENVGDFMSKRILDHAWPRFKRLLESQRRSDRQSALARRAGSAGAGAGIGTESAHTTSHRLYMAILSTAKYILQEVPITDELLWEIIFLLRPFLDHRAHEEVQIRAMGVYEQAAIRDGDAVWVLLHASMGSLEDDNWKWMRDDRLDITRNAALLLSRI